MAKELPYFKFEPNQWENGNIQICSHKEKGVYIDLCSMYWSRLGDVPYKLAVQKICGGNATALDLLYEEKIIDIQDGLICINFLNEQLLEFENTSNQNSKNAKDGWVKRRKIKELEKNKNKNNATALQTQSESDAIREEEIREDKRREDKEIVLFKKETKFNFKNSLIEYGFNKDLIDDWLKVRKAKNGINTKTSFKSFITEIEKSTLDKNEILKICIERDWKGYKKEWIDNLTTNNNGNKQETVTERNKRDSDESTKRMLDQLSKDIYNNENI